MGPIFVENYHPIRSAGRRSLYVPSRVGTEREKDLEDHKPVVDKSSD